MGSIDFWRTAEIIFAAMGTIDFWRTAGIIFTAVGQTAFVLLYLFWPWWKNFLGRALFFKALALAVLVDVAVIGRMVDWRYEDATFVVLYWVMGFGVWFQFTSFLRVRLSRGQNVVSRNGDL
jgi:hypothetical protein